MRLSVFIVVACIALWPFSSAFASPAADHPAKDEASAGFEHLTTPAGVEVGIWYPARGEAQAMPVGMGSQQVVTNAPLPKGRYPLIVISHGTGGAYTGHADTAIALAKSGFVVAALTHPGDNWRDQSKVSMVEGRPRALSALIDFMLTTWRGHLVVDASQIAAFGFSAGGFTVLAAAGGRPDLAIIARHCVDHPNWFDCRLLAKHPRGPIPAWQLEPDLRIKALVVAAPALGFTFDKAGLSRVTMPVQLWRADEDEILPAPDYADTVLAALPRRPDFHAVSGAGHFDFLMPCTTADVAPELCRSKPGFDRTAFHRDFNAQIVRFLNVALKRGAGEGR